MTDDRTPPGPTFDTLLFHEDDGVATVTLNRPERHNAFDSAMVADLQRLWATLRHRDSVRCVVLTGAGDQAFCTGIDRHEIMSRAASKRSTSEDMEVYGATPWTYDDPARIGPKTCDYWKPVIAAVNGMACGGAFYLLGEVEFIVAAEHATFFDPHVTYNMTAGFEPIHLLQKMPFQEIMRLSLLGAHERMSAARAFEVGLVSEVVAGEDLLKAAQWAAQTIAASSPLAVGGTLRALWTGLEVSRQQALGLAYMFVRMGTDIDHVLAAQERFKSGQRIEWRTR